MTEWRFIIQILGVLLFPGIDCLASENRDTDSYWDMPIPAQSPAPPSPEACAACHADNYTDWSGSRHARAFSPGLFGQIMYYAEADAASCLNCHAPMAEQQTSMFQADLESLAADMQDYRPVLQARHGVYCAACHLRDGVLHAPGATRGKSGTPVHEHVRISPFFRDSRFCAACHQFDETGSVNGKPLQNTYREWLESPYAEQGLTCQGCHMPERAHTFRGIHDADMVRQGLTITSGTSGAAAVLTVQSTGVGHLFPTYIVPRVRLTGTLLDADGHQVPDEHHELILQRHMSIDNGHWVEHSDTRLAPGDAATLSIPWRADGECAQSVHFRIVVEPEWFYHEKVYPVVLQELENGPAYELITQAKSAAEKHSFTLFETTLSNACPN